MKLGSVDQVEAFLAHALEARNNFAFERLHACRITHVPGEIEIEMFTQQAFGRTGKTREWILDHGAKQTFAKFAVINRRAQAELCIQFLVIALPELHIVFPASEEKLPLQLGHLDQL